LSFEYFPDSLNRPVSASGLKALGVPAGYGLAVLHSHVKTPPHFCSPERGWPGQWGRDYQLPSYNIFDKINVSWDYTIKTVKKYFKTLVSRDAL
jgi:hypothetical protein